MTLFGKTGCRVAFSVVAIIASQRIVLAQNGDHWDKTYSVSPQPTVFLTSGDSNLEIKSCGDCRTVRIHIDAKGRKLSDYRLEEDQAGNTIHFSLKKKVHAGMHFSINWSNSNAIALQVETPASLTLQAETSDGNLDASGLKGAIDLRSSDGRQTIVNIAGTLKVQSGDGAVELRDIAGTLDAHTSDGNLYVSGKLDGLNVHTSDGSLTLELAAGSALKADSTLRSADGSITVRLPKDLSANFDISSSDGKIDCNLPLTLDGFQSNSGSGDSVRGKMNAGGPLFSIHTSDGRVHLSSL